MRRILVIGCGGAGKSSLATTLGQKLDLPVIHLDALYWQPGWQVPAPEDWKQTVAQLIQQESWVMDGNYGGTLEERLPACDTVVFLALSRYLCLYRVLKRAVRYHGKVRPDMGPDCPERFPTWEFLWWIWRYPRLQMPKVLELLAKYEGRKEIHVLRSSSEVERFLSEIDLRAMPREACDI